MRDAETFVIALRRIGQRRAAIQARIDRIGSQNRMQIHGMSQRLYAIGGNTLELGYQFHNATELTRKRCHALRSQFQFGKLGNFQYFFS